MGDDYSAFGLADFDRYVEEHGIPEEDYPAAFALSIAEVTGGPVPRFEKVERPDGASEPVVKRLRSLERACDPTNPVPVEPGPGH
jgi:hypothetical protein